MLLVKGLIDFLIREPPDLALAVWEIFLLDNSVYFF